MKIHDLKTSEPYYSHIVDGYKTFEIRRDDRGFKVGDLLNLQRYVDGEYTGYYIRFKIIYICDFEQKENYVVMGIKESM